MSNDDVIHRRLAGLKMQVEETNRVSLLHVMPAALDESLWLHKELEGGRTYHRETEDSHGAAVAHGGELLFSEKNDGKPEEESRFHDVSDESAKKEAEDIAKDNGGAYKGTFVATMDADFLSVRYETQVQEIIVAGLKKSFVKEYATTAKQHRKR